MLSLYSIVKVGKLVKTIVAPLIFDGGVIYAKSQKKQLTCLQ